MDSLWLTLTIIIWVAGGIYAGYYPEKFYRYGKKELDWEELLPFGGIVFVAGLFSVPVVGIALIVASICLPAYGLFKLGQKLRAKRDSKDTSK